MKVTNSGRCDGIVVEDEFKKKAKRRLVGTAVLSFFAVCTLPLIFKAPGDQLSHPVLILKRGSGLYECATVSADTAATEAAPNGHKNSQNERFVSVQSSAHLPGHILISTQSYPTYHTVSHAHTPHAPVVAKKHTESLYSTK